MARSSLLLATRSGHKAAEVARILEPLGFRLESLADRAIEETPEEQAIEAFDTFRENATAKARHFARLAAAVALADDSGLRVDALGGAPGVRTRRFSGREDLAGQDLDDANNATLLERLKGVPDDQRGARYVCCAAVAWPDGRSLLALGTVAGRIAREPRGDGGFGYDPLFHVPALGARFAEVPAAVKDASSHRARAFRALASALQAAPWPLRD
ncbi:MAG TPA: non-canonical purine NTP pyrophosphatase [Longimicrobiales bacterium]|nr:non-canonical purine NTP pyrophosphatase [Longimicrobiales bacterium]